MMKTENKYQNTSQIEKLEKEIAEIEAAAHAEVEAPKQEEKTLDSEEQSFKKRYGDLRRFSQKREDELRKEMNTLREEMAVLKREKTNLPQVAVSDEEFEAWVAKYPDVYAKIVKTVEKQVRITNEQLEKKLQEREVRELNNDRANAYRELLALHPDFDEIKVTDDFVAWAETQPLWVYNALYNNDTDAHAAARAVDLYKMDRKPKKEKKDRSDDARSVRTSSSTPDVSSTPGLKFTESSVAKMSWREYEKNEEAINEAMKNPAFYDLSGGAR